jgi:hypothetical protein
MTVIKLAIGDQTFGELDILTNAQVDSFKSLEVK